MKLEEFTLIPKGYKNKDPRSLLFLYPQSVNIVTYAKKMQTFTFYQSLEIAEDLAKRQGFILLPYECIHWQRAKLFGVDRKIKIGRKSYFMMRLTDLTKTETRKLENYLQELHEVG
jgi:hypothetical protein